MRWSHLVRHGLIGTSLLAVAAPRLAAAEPCDDLVERTLVLNLGFEVSPKLRLVGGAEVRQCVSDRSEAFARLELGGGTRMIIGARVRPFEPDEENRGIEDLGVEAGAVLDSHEEFGLHVAGTVGLMPAYLALQGRLPLSDGDHPMHFGLMTGYAPWAMAKGQVVDGRPITAAGRHLRPRVAAPLPVAASAEARAVRDHFVRSAQLELSSVWTFLRLAEELAAVGAPAALIARALDAADDEVRHAELCAQTAGGLTLAALPPGVARPRFASRTPEALAILADEAWREGCLNETAAAEQARLTAEEARLPMLATIARDEAGHAELAWAVLAWVASIAPAQARAATAALPSVAPVAPVDAALVRAGVPSAAITAAAYAHAETTARARRADLFT